MFPARGCFTFDEFAVFRAASLPAIDHKIGFEASVGGLNDAAIGVLSKNSYYVRRPLFQPFDDVREVSTTFLLKPGENFVADAGCWPSEAARINANLGWRLFETLIGRP